MNIYRGIIIFIMLIIIPFSTSQTLEERLRQNPGQGKLCKNNNECESYDKCTNGECRNPCHNLHCRLSEGCFVKNHIASCQCPSGYGYNSDYKCVKICSFDSDCGEHETCQKNGKIRICKCRAGFEIDTWANNRCRWKCTRDSDCASGSKCKHGRCVDHCDGVRCSQNEVCKYDATKTHQKCQCSIEIMANREGRCR